MNIFAMVTVNVTVINSILKRVINKLLSSFSCCTNVTMLLLYYICTLSLCNILIKTQNLLIPVFLHFYLSVLFHSPCFTNNKYFSELCHRVLQDDRKKKGICKKIRGGNRQEARLWEIKEKKEGGSYLSFRSVADFFARVT